MSHKRPPGGENKGTDRKKKQKTEHHNADQESKGKSDFKKSAFLVINNMVDLNETLTDRRPELVDELLHSIFFLGVINDPKCTPEEIVTDANRLNDLQSCYPRPFQLCSSQLPRRSPMSCVLDLIVSKEGQENEDKIKERLQELTCKLKDNEATDLVSSTICVSRANSEMGSVRYYGVSMSTSGSIPGKIMVGASCLSAWDSYVAGAVMTYYPGGQKGPQKKCFDGTIALPEQVKCEAFNISCGEKMNPCKSCGNLFGLTTSETQMWPYGHCAEVESLSNLLKGEEGVRKGVRVKTEHYTDADRMHAENEVRKELNNLLKNRNPKNPKNPQNPKFIWDKKFYDPTVKSQVN